MKGLIKRAVRKSGSIFGAGPGSSRARLEARTGLVSLQPRQAPHGNVLLSYIIDPFLLKPGDPISSAHSHDWESYQMAQSFLDMGYAVDVISYQNKIFSPRKQYSIFVAARTNFDRIAAQLSDNCLKIVHQDTAHWVFNNQAAYTRLKDVQERRSVTLGSIRIVEQNWAMENAHCATVLGNRFTMDTYRYAGKEIYRVPISSPTIYPWPENKDFSSCRTNFLWFGSAGFVHKGLDLVLEAFVEAPDLHLTICGPIDKDPGFQSAYYKELYGTPNIHTHGWVDVESNEFTRIAEQCSAVIYPSCSEGGGGSVITCMHAGLVPLVSYESSVDVEDFGVILPGSSVKDILKVLRDISSISEEECRTRARKAWEYARKYHTRETFSKAYKSTIEAIIPRYQ